MNKRVIVIGGGAAGLTAAIAAAGQGADVTILEHTDRVGKKILSTGNGRCNLSNKKIDETCYRCSQNGFPMAVLSQFPLSDTLAFFEGLGLMIKDKNGYLYPHSEQASSVLDALRLETERKRVAVVTGCEVRQIRRGRAGGYTVTCQDRSLEADALVLATGSMAAPKTGSDGSGYELARRLGHRVIRPLPALVQLRCAQKYFKEVAGVRCEARVTLESGRRVLASDTGELQLTDYGISGIPVFQVSRYASVALAKGEPVDAYLNFLPTMKEAQVRAFLSARTRLLGDRLSADFLLGVLPKKLAALLLKLAEIPPAVPVREVRAQAWERLALQLTAFHAQVTAANSFDQAQVCCGGVDTREVDPRTMESRLCPELYLAGELLDVDGICGGYNLQWAWSTGMIAGKNAGRRKNDPDYTNQTAGGSHTGGFKK